MPRLADIRSSQGSSVDYDDSLAMWSITKPFSLISTREKKDSCYVAISVIFHFASILRGRFVINIFWISQRCTVCCFTGRSYFTTCLYSSLKILEPTQLPKATAQSSFTDEDSPLTVDHGLRRHRTLRA